MSKTKICKRCGVRKSLTKFYNSKVYPTGKAYTCKTCQSEMRNRWIKDDDARYRESNRRAGLKYKFGMTIEQFDKMLADQGGCCAVCKTTNPNGEGIENGKNKQFSIDHDHTTGKIRGLLCNKCNRCLSFMQDSVTVLTKAITYLKKHNKRGKQDG